MEHTEKQTIYTVSDLTRTAKALLEQYFGAVWVEGELSNLAMPRSGHWYFTLKDDHAQIRCAFFRPTTNKCNFTPEEGMSVKAFARTSIYPDRGDFQLIIEKLEQSGEGLLKKAFDDLKKKLEKQGLFLEKHKKPLPKWPKKLGVITSATGAAIHDILTVLKRRFPGLPVIVYPSPVQGEKAHLQLIQAIETANKRKDADVLLLARGGGSLEDLWAFNEEALAHAIFNSTLPILTGIGHEPDVTIADLIADVRAPTPSAAAELVSPDQEHWLRVLNNYYKQCVKTIEQHLYYYAQKIDNLNHRLKHPKDRIAQLLDKNNHLAKTLVQLMKHQLQQQQYHLSNLATQLDAISPLATLKRGYAIAMKTKTKQAITSTKQITLGETVFIQLHQGQLSCEVTKLHGKK